MLEITMAGSGVPILISRNCSRASKNARIRRLDYSQNLTGIRFAHSHDSQRISLQSKCQPSHGLKFTSCNYGTFYRPISSSTLSKPVNHFKSLCAIKVQSSCQKNVLKHCWQQQRSTSTNRSSPLSPLRLSVTRSSTTPCLNSAKICVTHDHRVYMYPVIPGVRGLSSQGDPPASNKTKLDEQGNKLSKNRTEELPIVLKPLKDGDKKEATTSAKDAIKGDSSQVKKVEPEVKPYSLRRRKVDYSKKHTENITITPHRAMEEYLLQPKDLESLKRLRRRTPYDTNPNEPPLHVYKRRAVEDKAKEVWGSIEALNKEKTLRWKARQISHYSDYYTTIRNDSDSFMGEIGRGEQEEKKKSFFSMAGSHVVASAICINAANFVFKLVGWMYSGSASMFSEAIHSAADTINQLILAWGIHSATKSPSKDHPYGYATMTYVSSLISGVGIFCVGSGLSCYHGIMGLMHPEAIESLYWSYVVLAGSLLSEGATLWIAIDAIKKGAAEKNVSFFEYVWSSRNPSVNVVFLEDAAAVLGVIAAGSCMGLTSLTGNPMYDSIGSLAVGGILAAVSGFLVYTNTQALVGRSISEDQLAIIIQMLVHDPVVRGVYDIKATDMGVGLVRFKAEIDFDGREVTRAYLDKQDVDSLFKSVKSKSTTEEIEDFLLSHGEEVVDMLGEHVDRLEKQIKKVNPEVRHVDLEIM